MTAPFQPQKLLWALPVFALLVLTGCGGSDTKTASTSSEASVSVAAPEAPEDTTFTTKDGPDGQEVLAQFEIGNGYTDDMMLTKSQLATIKILNYAKTEYPNAAKVTVKGGLGDTVLFTATYGKSTLSKFDDFMRVPRKEIWDIADSARIDPALAK